MRKQEATRTFRSLQVARILGVSTRTLYRMLADGRIEEPLRDPDNRYRLWTEANIQEIREGLEKK